MLAPWIALLLPLFIYCVGFHFQGGGDSTPAELLPISLLRGGGFDFREFVSGELPYWYRSVRGRIVSNYPVLPGLLNVPLYSAAAIAGVNLEAHHRFLSGMNASILAALSALFLYLALTRVCRPLGRPGAGPGGDRPTRERRDCGSACPVCPALRKTAVHRVLRRGDSTRVVSLLVCPRLLGLAFLHGAGGIAR